MSFLPDHPLLAALPDASEEQRFRTLFDRYFAGLLHLAERIVHCPHEAEEVVLDVFTKVWHQREELVVHGNVPGYLASAVRNRSIDYLRRRNRHRNITADLPIHRPCSAPSPEEQAATKQLQHLIEAAIQELPTRGQQIFRLNRFSGLTYQQIADTHGLSPKTVETHMRRNLIFLRNRLQRYCDLPL
ncbi:RNA polymerase sigma-70 factor [Neolewinella lacunae]|uniref:RNA polymerase sigma-70 factor n=1 Tax=Neolewinella lacunae TaxID=1517758 RepID=A0A923PMU3_9BACT|nr:RNA polymerase sigma-70 factor [Neolewinella lacunae]MBC6994576.1 RNA polymerase sigma-70 factor [Neolewinella lacunae]MDN3633925.1 RNA polymerase sigma-70 factor [Neolewinella lacunae]